MFEKSDGVDTLIGDVVEIADRDNVTAGTSAKIDGGIVAGNVWRRLVIKSSRAVCRPFEIWGIRRAAGSDSGGEEGGFVSINFGG